MVDDRQSPQVLMACSNEVEAAAVVTALAAHGIQASTTGGFTAGFRAEAPGDVRVVVRQEDLEKAREMLGQIRREMTDIDWSQVDVGDEICGSSQST